MRIETEGLPPVFLRQHRGQVERLAVEARSGEPFVVRMVPIASAELSSDPAPGNEAVTVQIVRLTSTLWCHPGRSDWRVVEPASDEDREKIAAYEAENEAEAERWGRLTEALGLGR